MLYTLKFVLFVNIFYFKFSIEIMSWIKYEASMKKIYKIKLHVVYASKTLNNIFSYLRALNKVSLLIWPACRHCKKKIKKNISAKYIRLYYHFIYKCFIYYVFEIVWCINSRGWRIFDMKLNTVYIIHINTYVYYI